jgi:ribonuclease R
MPKPPVYPALVIDVRNFGFFVDVPGLAMSGLIHCSSLTDDFYEFDEARGTLTGRRNRRVFRLGDNVEVQIAKVDSFKKQVDFRLAREERSAVRPQPKDRDRSPVAAGEPRRNRPQFEKSRDWRSAADGDRPRSERQPKRGPQRFQDRQQPRPQSRPQPGQQSRGQSRPPKQKSGQFKTQSQSRPPLPSRPSRDAKSQPARPQSGGGNFQAGPARPQIPSSHSRSKFGGRRRR